VFPFPRPQRRRSRVWIRIYGTGQNRIEVSGARRRPGGRYEPRWRSQPREVTGQGQTRGEEGRDFCCGFYYPLYLLAGFFFPSAWMSRGVEEESGEHDRKGCESAKSCRTQSLAYLPRRGRRAWLSAADGWPGLVLVGAGAADPLPSSWRERKGEGGESVCGMWVGDCPWCLVWWGTRHERDAAGSGWTGPTDS
jgi:hypothetical protein